ncbi:MAG: hypothetical protein HQK51_11205, partial [Oligoflexia bacterium]|nr:hypothetical protein [Oligoflexia bacterium]
QVKMTIFPTDCLYELEYEHWFNENLKIDTKPLTIHEDDQIIITSKPPFMATYPTGRHSFNCVTVHYENIHKKPLHSIHRLDRETSGTLILGKNPTISRSISFCFEHNLVKKCYFLIAKNKLNLSAQSFPLTAEERIGRSKDFFSRVLMNTFDKDSAEGKEAKTIFRFIDQIDNYLLLLAYPHTGRQHQIRVHAAAHGFPLIGDKIYNGDPNLFIRYKDKVTTEQDYEELELPRHALHAIALNFPYDPNINIAQLPVNERNSKNIKSIMNNTKRTIFTTPIPNDLREWIKSKNKIKSKNHSVDIDIDFDIKQLEDKIKDDMDLIWSNISSRYPDAFPEGAPYEYFTEEQAKEAVDFSEKILIKVREHFKV